MSSSPVRVYAARLVGLPIFDPQGDQVGKVRDVVAAVRSETSQPRVLGLVGEVFGRRRIFVPMTRVTNIDSGQVYTTGLLNMRRFEQRTTETLVIGQMLDRTVTIPSSGVTGVVYDVALEQARSMAMFAAMSVGEADALERDRAVSAAKVQIGRSARFIGQQAIQLHGGVGMTMEYKVGHLFKRVTMIDTLFGDADHHVARLAERGGLPLG